MVVPEVELGGESGGGGGRMATWERVGYLSIRSSSREWFDELCEGKRKKIRLA